MAAAEPIISCSGVTKSFRLPRHEHGSLRGRILHPFTKAQWDEFDALHNVSFDVQKGEFYGIVGRNGCGKSTLLKVIAGIYKANAGTVTVRGSLAPFIELGVGFNGEQSGRDNLFVNGALLGLSRKELKMRYDRIVEFAELEDFMDLRLRNFSSGMQVRLAFSIAIESGTDILLVDEVLAVGDERFQRKCYDVFKERKRRGQTIVFVSHDMHAVNAFCDRALLLERGNPVDEGDAQRVTRAYRVLNLDSPAEEDDSASTDLPIVIERVQAGKVALDGVVTVELEEGDTFALEVECDVVRAVDGANLFVHMRDHLGQLRGSYAAEIVDGALHAGDHFIVRVSVGEDLLPGVYDVGVFVLTPAGEPAAPSRARALRLLVNAENSAEVETHEVEAEVELTSRAVET